MALSLLKRQIRDLGSIGNNPGVYIIENKISKKVYVGSSQKIGSRLRSHARALVRGLHHCSPLQNSWNVHGLENFLFFVWEIVDDEAIRLVREQVWLDFFEQECGVYNINPKTTPGNHSPMSPKARQVLLRCSQLPKSAEHVEKVRLKNLGQKRTPEQRARMSAARKRVCQDPKIRQALSQRAKEQFSIPENRARLAQVNVGRKLSDEQKEAIRKFHKGRPKPVGFGAKISAANKRRNAHLSLHPWMREKGP